MTIIQPTQTAITSAGYTAIKMPDMKLDIAFWTEAGTSFTYSESSAGTAVTVPADTSVSIANVDPDAQVAFWARTVTGSDNLVVQAAGK